MAPHADVPFVSAQAVVVFGVHDGVFALRQGDSAERVAVAKPSVPEHRQHGQPFQPARYSDSDDELDDFPLPRLPSRGMSNFVSCLEFRYSYLAKFRPGGETRAPIIGATCAFDAKIYKNVGGVFAVSAYEEGNKRIFKNSDFCSALSSLLVEKFPPKSSIENGK